MKISDTMRDAITAATLEHWATGYKVTGRRSTLKALESRKVIDANGYLTEMGQELRTELTMQAIELEDANVTVIEDITPDHTANAQTEAWDAQMERDDAIRRGERWSFAPKGERCGRCGTGQRGTEGRYDAVHVVDGLFYCAHHTPVPQDVADDAARITMGDALYVGPPVAPGTGMYYNARAGRTHRALKVAEKRGRTRGEVMRAVTEMLATLNDPNTPLPGTERTRASLAAEKTESGVKAALRPLLRF